MRKNELALLERAFAMEVEAALGHYALSMVQTKSKTAQRLVALNMLRPVERKLHGATFKGYELTEYGRLIYCTAQE